MATARTKLLGMCDVIMRVPPLFIIDEILKISSTAFSAGSYLSGGGQPGEEKAYFNETESNHTADQPPYDDELRFYNVATSTFKFLACSLGKYDCFACPSLPSGRPH